MRRVLNLAMLLGLALSHAMAESPSPAANVVDPKCQTLETAALVNDLPLEFLTRLIWQESRFDAFAVSRAGGPAHISFLALVVLNLVGGFQALGTLLAVGMIILPAVTARFWARDITGMVAVAVLSAAISGYGGLLVSYHANLPSGPAIILAAGLLYAFSVIAGPVGGLLWSALPQRHLEA